MKKIILFSIFLVCFFNLLSAVLFHENTQLIPSELNTTFIFANNLTFNSVNVSSTYINLDSNVFFANVSSGSLNIIIFNFTDTYKKWNESVSNSSSVASYFVSGFSSGSSQNLKKSGVSWQTLTANSSGYVNFNYSGEHNVYFELLPVSVSPPSNPPSGDSSGGSSSSFPLIIANQTELESENGYSKSLAQKWRMKFNSNNETHELKIDEVDNQKITITISPNPITFELFVGETKKVNLEENNFSFFVVYLDSIKGDYVNLSFSLVNESISDDINDEEEVVGNNYSTINEKEIINDKNSFIKNKLIFLFIFLFILIIILIIVFLFLRFQQNKRDYLLENPLNIPKKEIERFK